MDRAEAVEDCRKFLFSIESHAGSMYAFGKVIHEVAAQTHTLLRSPCHAGFVAQGKPPIAMCSGFPGYNFHQPHIERAWQWLTNPKTSPWRTIIKDIELVRSPKTNIPLGFIFGEEVTRKTNFNFLKNFCILTRTMVEKAPIWALWKYLVEEKKMLEADAFYLAMFYMPKGMEQSNFEKADFKELHDNANNYGGGHFALTDMAGEYGSPVAFDWKVWRSGNVPDKIVRGMNINGFFQDQSSHMVGYKRYSSTGLQFKQVQGKFAKSSYYDVNDVIDNFYKWQDQEGILA